MKDVLIGITFIGILLTALVIAIKYWWITIPVFVAIMLTKI